MPLLSLIAIKTADFFSSNDSLLKLAWALFCYLPTSIYCGLNSDNSGPNESSVSIDLGDGKKPAEVTVNKHCLKHSVIKMKFQELSVHEGKKYMKEIIPLLIRNVCPSESFFNF